MTKIFFLLAAVMGLLASVSAQANKPPEGWSKVGQSKDAIVYLRDKDWLNGRPDTQQILVWGWYSVLMESEWSSMVSLYEISCTREMLRTLKTTLYNIHGQPTMADPTDWTMPTPGSLTENILKATCSNPNNN